MNKDKDKDKDKEYVTVNLIVIGPSQVGKTSIIQRFVGNTFNYDNYDRTIGVDLSINTIKMKNIGNELKTMDCKIRIWDTSGLDCFKSIISNYLQKIDGIMLVYDISDRKSLTELKNWHKWLQTVLPDYSKKSIVIVGNKNDLYKERQVFESEVKEWIESYMPMLSNHNSIECTEVCSKNNVNIFSVFMNLSKNILEKRYGRNTTNNDNNEFSDNALLVQDNSTKNINNTHTNTNTKGKWYKILAFFKKICNIKIHNSLDDE